MKYKIAMLIAALAMTGCDKTRNEPVEVRVVRIWTIDDITALGNYRNTYIPHTVVETTDTTKRRYRVFDWPPIGATGEVFSVSRHQLKTL